MSWTHISSRASFIVIIGISMAASRDSPALLNVVSCIHLIFTITSVAFLSYKVYFLESELSLIQGKISIQEHSDIGNSVSQATPLALTAPATEQIKRKRRNLQAQPSSADQLDAICAQKVLNDLQVLSTFFADLTSFYSQSVLIPKYTSKLQKLR